MKLNQVEKVNIYMYNDHNRYKLMPYYIIKIKNCQLDSKVKKLWKKGKIKNIEGLEIRIIKSIVQKVFPIPSECFAIHVLTLKYYMTHQFLNISLILIFENIYKRKMYIWIGYTRNTL